MAKKDSVFRALDEGKTLIFNNEVVSRYYLTEYARCGHTVLADRCMSFDTFKEISVPCMDGYEKASQMTRRIFASEIIPEGKLRCFTNSRFPETYARFSTFIASMLPDLAEMKEDENLSKFPQDMRADILYLYSSYSDFLDRNRLYEESWLETDPSRIKDCHYAAVFPDIKNGEMKFLRRASRYADIEFIEVPEPGKPTYLETFDNISAEVRTVLRRIRYLLENGTRAEDILLTVCDMDMYQPILREEARLRSVPLSMMDNRPLIELPAGRFFTSISEMFQSEFSLSSMKEFLLDVSIPFRDMELNRQFINDAVEANIEGGSIDGEDNYLKKLHEDNRKLYFALKNLVLSICRSQTVTELRKGFFAIQQLLLRDERWKDHAGESSYSFCMDLFEQMAQSMARCDVESFPGLFSFFISLIADTTYISQEKGQGVSVMRYPLSASMDVRHHFGIGFSYSGTHESEQLFSFFSQGDFEEEDVTDSILRCICSSSGEQHLSYPVRSRRGTDLAPSYFLERGLIRNFDPSVPMSSDCLADEMAVWNNEDGVFHASPALRDSFFRSYSQISSRRGRSAIKYGDGRRLSLSSTSIDTFITCPFKWMAKYVMNIQKKDYEPVKLDHKEIGTMLHAVFETFFNEYDRLDPERRDEYRKRILEIYDDEFRKFCTSQRPSIPAKVWMDAEYHGKICDIIDQEMAQYPLAKVFRTEYAPDKCECDRCDLKGRIDKIIMLPEGGYGVIDYKKGAPPISAGKFAGQIEEGRLRSYQLPVYIRLLKNIGREVVSASYYSVKDGKFSEIIGGEDHERIVQLCDELLDVTIDRMLDRMEMSDFTPTPSSENCLGCDFRQLCRMRYAVR